MKESMSALSFFLIVLIGMNSGCATLSGTQAPASAPKESVTPQSEAASGPLNEVAKAGGTQDLSGAEPPDAELSEKASQALERMIQEVEEHVTQSEEEAEKQSPKQLEGRIPVEMNRWVKKWIQYFTVNDRERFQRFILRGERYRSVVQTVLKENGVPSDLFYLAMIESGYSTHAHSRAKAVGAWQFMRGTAVRYDLEVNHYLDERRDPIRATEAAAKYLTDLYNAFQDWYLAMAAYNAGERRILGAIMRGKSRDYWTLIEKKVLPAETRDYVPKFLAAVIIGRNLEKFGFQKELEQSEVYPDVEKVELPSPLRLTELARVSEVPLETLKEVNPHIIRGVTSPNQSTYEVWIPTAAVARLEAKRTQIASLRLRGIPKSIRTFDNLASDDRRKFHKVRPGESLASIAKKYHISIAYLRKINDIRGGSGKILAGQRLRLTTKSYRGSQVELANRASHRQSVRVSQSGRKSSSPTVRYYTVRKGDNLKRIARRFNTSVIQLKKVNRLADSRIIAGQSIRVD